MDAEIVERARRFLAEAAPPELAAAYLFGSVARGTSGPASDVDLAVLYEADRPPSFDALALRFEGEVERAVGRPVQLVVLNAAPVDLVHRVLRDGILLLERDRSARVRFEVRSRALYFDLLPFLRRYRRTEDAA